MKRLLFDFRCPDHGLFEELVYSEVNTQPCPKCSKESSKELSAPRLDWRNMGVDSGFPTAADKWEKMQRQKARTEDSPNLKMY
jgi:hypothetical protein